MRLILVLVLFISLGQDVICQDGIIYHYQIKNIITDKMKSRLGSEGVDKLNDRITLEAPASVDFIYSNGNQYEIYWLVNGDLSHILYYSSSNDKEYYFDGASGEMIKREIVGRGTIYELKTIESDEVINGSESELKVAISNAGRIEYYFQDRILQIDTAIFHDFGINGFFEIIQETERLPVKIEFRTIIEVEYVYRTQKSCNECIKKAIKLFDNKVKLRNLTILSECLK